MIIKNIIMEDFVNYKKPSMVIAFPYCTFKCGKELCQNNELLKSPDINISVKRITELYINNPITNAIVMQGMEPFDSLTDLLILIYELRQVTNDDIVIYTGYKEEEIQHYINAIKDFKNIIIKFGRYIPNIKSHYDEILGVYLASDNQYGKRVSND